MLILSMQEKIEFLYTVSIHYAVKYVVYLFQSPDDSALTIVNIIRHHETEYLSSLEVLTTTLSVFLIFK